MYILLLGDERRMHLTSKELEQMFPSVVGLTGKYGTLKSNDHIFARKEHNGVSCCSQTDILYQLLKDIPSRTPYYNLIIPHYYPLFLVLIPQQK